MDGSKDVFIRSSSMQATSKSLALVSDVLGFDLVELWAEIQEGKLNCIYVHAAEETILRYPEINVGHYPNHTREHKISPQLCELARRSSTRCHWEIMNPNSVESSVDSIRIPIVTEMAYMIGEGTGDAYVYIVGIATKRIIFKEQKLKFLTGVSYAIYVAAFDLDEDPDKVGSSDAAELDANLYCPLRPLVSMTNVVDEAGGTNSRTSPVPTAMGVWNKNASNSALSSLTPPSSQKQMAGSSPKELLSSSSSSSPNKDSIGMKLSDYAMTRSTEKPPLPVKPEGLQAKESFMLTQSPPQFPLEREMSGSVANSRVFWVNSVSTSTDEYLWSPSQNPPLELSRSVSHLAQKLLQEDPDADAEKSRSSETRKATAEYPVATTLPPTWEPTADFQFPVIDIPIKQYIPDEFTVDNFERIKHVADGSHANVYTGRLNGVKVIIKMLKESSLENEVAIREFDLEHGMLCRVSHPNIIRILGAGTFPRRFMVLEYLASGTLQSILTQNEATNGLAQMLWKKPSFTYANLLRKAKEIASGLDYLHFKCHAGATIIHRDLKPNNIGFAADGTLKIFDFGLVTCVKARRNPTDAYEMTGCTGSLRYMAPEVALRQPYSEKADVYSFGILLWQMARDRVPFKGMSKEEYMEQVVAQQLRPQLDKNWPSRFSSLLTKCWEHDPLKRPSFSKIIEELNILINEDTVGVSSAATPKKMHKTFSDTSKKKNSIWF